MVQVFISTLMLFLVMSPAFSQSQGSVSLTIEQVKQQIIRESITVYPGNCPCPYNRDRAGRSCGRRSAYSKPGGYSPLCYPSDISDEMVMAWRARNP